MGSDEVKSRKNFLYIDGLTECDQVDVALPFNFHLEKEISCSQISNRKLFC